MVQEGHWKGFMKGVFLYRKRWGGFLCRKRSRIGFLQVPVHEEGGVLVRVEH